ncbi:MAG TPA: hypothetical protein VN824_12890, partial [Puia sp.]|nr:hypothetical protein [Puia sp.]
MDYLLKQYLDNLITKDEFAELLLHLENEGSSTELQAVLERLIMQSPEAVDYQEENWEPLYQKVLQASTSQEHAEKPVHGGSIKSRRFDRRWMMAAAAVLVLGTGFLWYQQQRAKLPVSAPLLATTHDLAPGTNKATLTLADGTTIDLDAARNGVLGQQGKTRLIKSKDEELVYQPGQDKRVADSRTSAGNEARYNLLTTPRGGQYQLQLPDGSKVWLNAATSLRYPTSFTGADRVVELKG